MLLPVVGCQEALAKAEGNTADRTLFGPYGECQGDKYPQYQCALKYSDNPKQPVEYGDGPSSTFASGTTAL